MTKQYQRNDDGSQTVIAITVDGVTYRRNEKPGIVRTTEYTLGEVETDGVESVRTVTAEGCEPQDIFYRGEWVAGREFVFDKSKNDWTLALEAGMFTVEDVADVPRSVEFARQQALARITVRTEAAKAAGYTGIEGIVIPFHAHVLSQLQAAAALIPARIATEQSLSVQVCIENGDNDLVLTYQQIAEHGPAYTVAAGAGLDAWSALKIQFNAASTIEEYDAIAAEE